MLLPGISFLFPHHRHVFGKNSEYLLENVLVYEALSGF